MIFRQDSGTVPEQGEIFIAVSTGCHLDKGFPPPSHCLLQVLHLQKAAQT